MGRKPKRREVSSHDEQRRAARFSSQLYIWRYCENHWWQMSEGFGFRTPMPPRQQANAHNLALYSRNHWHVYSITYLRDAGGRRYREFSYHRTKAQITGAHDGVAFLMGKALEAGEANLNAKHIYGRAMVFGPWTSKYPSLVPILRMKMKQLRLTEDDIAAMAEHEKEQSMTRSIALPERPEPPAPPEIDIDAQIAALLPNTPEKEEPDMTTNTYPSIEDTVHALHHPVRRSVLLQLREDARLSSSQMMKVAEEEGIKVSQSGFAQHMKVLREAGMVDFTRHQTGSTYFRTPKAMNGLIELLNKLS